MTHEAGWARDNLTPAIAGPDFTRPLPQFSENRPPTGVFVVAPGSLYFGDDPTPIGKVEKITILDDVGAEKMTKEELWQKIAAMINKAPPPTHPMCKCVPLTPGEAASLALHAAASVPSLLGKIARFVLRAVIATDPDEEVFTVRAAGREWLVPAGWQLCDKTVLHLFAFMARGTVHRVAVFTPGAALDTERARSTARALIAGIIEEAP